MKTIPVDIKREVQEKKLTTTLPRLLEPVSMVDSLVTSALQTSAAKMGRLDDGAFIALLQQGDSLACNYYCYNIVRELGEVLGSWSKNIKSVYSCSYDDITSGEDFCEKSTRFPLIHMIIQVEQKSKALEALIAAIDGALVQRHRRMLGPGQLEHVLDAQVIDDADVRNRAGYAALLNSVYQPPIQVWRSSPNI